MRAQGRIDILDLYENLNPLSLFSPSDALSLIEHLENERPVEPPLRLTGDHLFAFISPGMRRLNRTLPLAHGSGSWRILASCTTKCD